LKTTPYPAQSAYFDFFQIPNASYGPGWECNWGYREVDETRVAIEVPPNAYLNSSGSTSWTCDRGYRPADEACVGIDVPANG